MGTEWIKEMIHLAEVLKYPFFIADNSLRSWSHPTSRLLEIIGCKIGELEENPECWIKRVDHKKREELIALFDQFDTSEDEIEFQITINDKNDRAVDLNLFFFRMPCSGKSDFYLGVIRENSREFQYKLDALKARDFEIEISARIQRGLLTGAFTGGNEFYEFAADTLPSNQVDGDFYEFINLSDDTVDFIVGDVMGKGVPAALLAAAVKSAFFKVLINLAVNKKGLPPIPQVLSEIEQSISEDLISIKSFLTLYYCRVEYRSNLLSFIDAGHTSIAYYSAADECCWSVKGSNMPIGFLRNQEYRDYLLPLGCNDLLFFYSDGITEVVNSEKMIFGYERLEQLLNAHNYLNPADLVKKVMNVAFFYASEDFKDDVTAIAIRIKNPGESGRFTRKPSKHEIKDLNIEALRIELEKDLRLVNPAIEEEILSGILIAYLEALGNCVNFATGIIRTGWAISSKRCEITIQFQSADYQWYSVQGPAVEEYQEHKYGLYLIHQAMDSMLLLQRSGDYKKMVMIKELK